MWSGERGGQYRDWSEIINLNFRPEVATSLNFAHT